MEKEVEDPGGAVAPAAGSKRKTVPSPGEQDEESEAGGREPKATRKATLRRDGGESLSSSIYQGSVRAKVARDHQKPCRVVRHEYYEGFFRTNEIGDVDVSRRDAN